MGPLNFICNQKYIAIFILFYLEHTGNDQRQGYQESL